MRPVLLHDKYKMNMHSIKNRLLLKGRKNKKTIIIALLALAATTGQAQTKTATVTGYSPALKDGTLVLAGTGTIGNVVDTVQAGRFAFTLPVEELFSGFLYLVGEGCPHFSFSLLTLSSHAGIMGTGCLK